MAPETPKTAPAGRLVFSNAGTASTLSRQQRAGRAVRLAPGVYVSNASLPASELARHHVWAIVAHVWPGTVICDRSAMAGGISDSWLFLCHPAPDRGSDLVMPGVSVTCRVGPGPLPGDLSWPRGLHLSGGARGLVENISVGGRPPKGRPVRPAGAVAVGDRIDALARSGDLGRVRDTLAELEQIADHFEPKPVEKVRELLVAALGTATGGSIASSLLAARVSGEPYDASRGQLFEQMRADLEATAPSVRPLLGHPDRRSWLPFFEAYFSNYIEGTVFSVGEARRIAIDDEVPAARPADAHDVSATYRIVNDPTLMRETPGDVDSLLEIMRSRHRILMAARPEMRPGHLKNQSTYAGGTAFVEPAQLVGTLRAGWEAMADIVDPFHRAVMMMFVVTECHPFNDGNGRLARIMANAELVARDQVRMIVPTCYRGIFLAALTAASNGAGAHALASVLDFTRRWVAEVDWSDWDSALADLETSNAFKDSVVAEHSGERLRLPR